MKKYSAQVVTLIIACLLAFVSLTRGQVTASTPQPETLHPTSASSWAAVLRLASDQKKHILVDCYATWCGPCKRMDREVFSDPKVNAALNTDYIVFRLQMDQTAKDSAEIKAHYPDVELFKRQYHVNAFPTFLFFSPEGILVDEQAGYFEVPAFLSIIKQANDPSRLKYFSDYLRFKTDRDAQQLGIDLILYTKDTIKDTRTADDMAARFCRLRLANLPEGALLTKEVLGFYMRFTRMIASGDNIFAIAYQDPAKVDRVTGQALDGKRITYGTITQEELRGPLTRDGKPLDAEPDWEALRRKLAAKYEKVDFDHILLKFQVEYYRYYQVDWKRWASYKDQLIKTDPPNGKGLSVFVDLNTYGTWDAFLNCFDSEVIAKSIEWIDLAMRLDPPSLAFYLDTKAQALYKIGRKLEAITLEEKAVAASPEQELYRDTLSKMKAGKPTWPSQQEVEAKKVVGRMLTIFFLKTVEPAQEPDWQKLHSLFAAEVGAAVADQAIGLSKLSYFSKRDPARLAATLVEYDLSYKPRDDYYTLASDAKAILYGSEDKAELQIALEWVEQEAKKAVNADSYKELAQKLREKSQALDKP